MQVFTRVVDTNSFSRAADSLEIPKGSVTRLIKELEAFLDTRLLNRTTRSLSVTAAGSAYYEQCRRVLAYIDEIESEFTDAQRQPRGRLRVDMSAAIGRLVVVPVLDEFQDRYPDIDLALGVGDRLVDLVQEGVDCALRIGNLEDSTLVARRIGLIPMITAASPSYLKRAGTPASPRDLAGHATVNYFSTRTGRMVNLDFRVDGEPVNVKLPSRLAANDGDMLMQCGARGLGLIQVPQVLARQYLDSGALVEVLADWRPAPLPISAVFPQSRHLSPQVRAFVNWVADVFERYARIDDLGPGSPAHGVPH